MRIPYLLQLHIIVLLWGFTPVLGKAISLQSMDLVFYRLFISGVALYLYMRMKGSPIFMPLNALGEVLLMGVIVGIHWYTFYEAIKVSNVSMAMAGFATITLFASLLQPILLKNQFYWGDVIYGLVILLGLLIIIDSASYYSKGIIYGMVSAFTGAFFGVYNGKLIVKHPATSITLVEFIGAILTIVLLQWISKGSFYFTLPDATDWILLLILSLVCTTLAFTWSIEILKYFTPFTVIITNNLEPIYAVIFSIFIFGESEHMEPTFYFGAGIILASVFTYPLIKKKLYNKMAINIF
jgi:drug/metabolite transporter (DMT)-like permease